jgi:hypothetical protein
LWQGFLNLSKEELALFWDRINFWEWDESIYGPEFLSGRWAIICPKYSMRVFEISGFMEHAQEHSLTNLVPAIGFPYTHLKRVIAFAVFRKWKVRCFNRGNILLFNGIGKLHAFIHPDNYSLMHGNIKPVVFSV